MKKIHTVIVSKNINNSITYHIHCVFFVFFCDRFCLCCLHACLDSASHSWQVPQESTLSGGIVKSQSLGGSSWTFPSSSVLDFLFTRRFPTLIWTFTAFWAITAWKNSIKFIFKLVKLLCGLIRNPYTALVTRNTGTITRNQLVKSAFNFLTACQSLISRNDIVLCFDTELCPAHELVFVIDFDELLSLRFWKFLLCIVDSWYVTLNTLYPSSSVLKLDSSVQWAFPFWLTRNRQSVFRVIFTIHSFESLVMTRPGDIFSRKRKLFRMQKIENNRRRSGW